MVSQQRRRRRSRGDPAEEVAQDRPEVRIFTLADHAATPPDGKLYISGAGVGQMWLPQIPGPLGPLWLVVRIRVPWHMTSEELPVRVRLLDADRKPVGPDPLFEEKAEVGRPPGFRPGDESSVNAVLGLQGFPVQAEGTVYFHLLVAGGLLSVLPLKIARRPAPPAVSQQPG